jgi:hypothetical protein
MPAIIVQFVFFKKNLNRHSWVSVVAVARPVQGQVRKAISGARPPELVVHAPALPAPVLASWHLLRPGSTGFSPGQAVQGPAPARPWLQLQIR